LQDDYEELRAYALSPAKTPSRPLGLDLWLKKGFLSWVVAMLFKISELESKQPPTMELEQPLLPENLLIPLTNILMEWSIQNDWCNQQ